MKKKRNFLSIISSIFGLFAICGFSVFGLLSRSKEKAIESLGADYLYIDEFSDTTQSITYNTSVVFNYDYTVRYIQVFDDTIYYYFNFKLDYYMVNGTHLLCDGYFNGPVKKTIYFSSQRFEQIFTDNTLFEFNLVSVIVSKRAPTAFPVLTSFVFNYSVGNDDYTLNVDGGSTYQFLTDGTDNHLATPAEFGTSGNDINLVSHTLMTSVSDYDLGYQDGYEDGYSTGYQNGSVVGFDGGYNQGLAQAEANYNSLLSQLQEQYELDLQEAYSNGYTAGYNEGFSTDSTAMTIVSGIFQVALVPINFFLGIFNFEILGINLSSIIQALFTIALTIIVIRSVVGGKSE